MAPEARVCVRCVMDTSDPEIVFDEKGVCSHCHYFDDVVKQRWFPNEEGRRRLGAIVQQIKEEGASKPYDCIIGLSGGADSSYLALKVRELGLRPLVLHVDAGWNSELAVRNIELLLKHCGWDLETVVIDWEEMRDLQIAYLKAGVSNQDVPQDHAFFAAMYHYAVKNRVRHVLVGGNSATEAIFPQSWHYSAMDSRNLKAIHRRFGRATLRTYPTISFWKYYLWYPFVRRLQVIRPLNYMPYQRSMAVRELETLGWRDYGRKHGESTFTRFFQNHYLVERFGYDKRRPHLSSRILAGEITRDEALAELAKPLYAPDELMIDRTFVLKKLGLSEDEWQKYLVAPRHDATEYPSTDRLYRAMKRVQRLVETRILRRSLARFS
ncbi:MAG: N-acetyl sugar amidotransferase [Candidatus Bipolaricaulota bacterium]|nr:N-acetyl sugar amidotransferase [Candidatus Bipolaricaulota bacterium]